MNEFGWNVMTLGKIFASAALSVAMGTTAMAGTITGSASYRERIALPPEAVLDVRLVDISRQDVAATVLSSKRYAMTGVPTEFSLEYDDALIDERFSYAVQASVYVGDRLLFTSDTVHPVLTRGQGDTAEVVMVKAGREMGTGLENTHWKVTQLSGKAIISERVPEIQFAEGGAFGAKGGCNSFRGEARVTNSKIAFPDNMAGTLMACPPPLDKLEKDFLTALTQVSGYVRNGEVLALTNDAGVAVMRLMLMP
ncbi:META domain protein [Falsiruegeria litorea R37]|uniref:META domain protein n=1 Tax=Falsiruegeria litorea R37 TaxID=1200284 RepID=A0A1Y5S570_9RHOB|nr:YbaY family lipoprotein [Falsiruegeria litorea]SLN31584.1 META domain protein [Falsiruegeria litorea R37]